MSNESFLNSQVALTLPLVDWKVNKMTVIGAAMLDYEGTLVMKAICHRATRW